MADNYTLCSFALHVSEEEKKYMVEVFERCSAISREDAAASEADPLDVKIAEDGYWGWELEVYPGEEPGTQEVIIFGDESPNLEAMVLLLQQEVLAVREEGAAIAFSWAETCSKMRPDHFTGGGVVVTKDSARWVLVGQELHRIKCDMGTLG